MFYCGLKAKMWTSSKETNLSKRFFACPKERVSVSHCIFVSVIQCYINCDVFLLRDNQCQFFLWRDLELG